LYIVLLLLLATLLFTQQVNNNNNNNNNNVGVWNFIISLREGPGSCPCKHETPLNACHTE